MAKQPAIAREVSTSDATRGLGPALNLQPGEGAGTALLFLHSFFMGASLVFFETAANAMFLASFPVTALPYVYIAAALVVTLAGVTFAKLERRVSYPRLLAGTLALLLVSVVAFRVVLLVGSIRYASLALLIWVEVLSVLCGLELWGLAGRLLDIRQGKRLYGLIGTGEVAAGVMGGFSVPVLVGVIGTPNLLLLAAAAMAANLIVLLALTRRFAARIRQSSHEDVRASSERPLAALLESRYVILMLAVAVSSVFGYYLLDYVFYDRVEARYTSQDALASFFGVFFACIGLVSLLTRTFVSGRILTKFGLTLGLLALPVAMIAGGAALSAVGTLSLFAAPVFWAAVIVKALDTVLRESIDAPSFLILFQPLPPAQRLRVQALVQSMAEPVAGGVAGVALLLFTHLLDLSFVHYAAMLVGVAFAWVILAWFLRSRYTVALMSALADRSLGSGTLSLMDASTTKILEARLQSPHAGEVLYSLEMLEQMEHPSLGPTLLRLLDHDSETVRLDVLSRLERAAGPDAMGRILKRLAVETAPRVRGHLLQTLAVLGETDQLDVVEPYLDDPSPLVRKGAMVGMLRGGGIEGVLAAGKSITALVSSARVDERRLAAEVLGEAGIASFHRPVAKLLQDDEPSVRRAAVIASGKIRSPRLWPLVVENLSPPLVRQAAMAALVSGGDDCLVALAAAFDAERQDRQVRVLIARICGRIGGPGALGILASRIGVEDQDVRHPVLLALRACGYRATGDAVGRVEQMIRDEGADAAWNLAGLLDLEGDERTSLLARALASELGRDRERILALLTFICPRQAVLRATDSLASETPEQRAYAVEVLDNVVASDLKRILFPLLEDIPYALRLERLADDFPQQALGAEARLAEVLARPSARVSAWTQACAAFAIGRSRIGTLRDSIVVALSSPSPLVRETAAWAMGVLAPTDFAARLRPLTTDASAAVSEMARFVLDSASLGRSSAIPASEARPDAGAEAIATILLDPAEARTRRVRAATWLASVRGPTARAALVDALKVEDESIRTAVLQALMRGRFGLDDVDRARLMSHLRDEVTDAEKTVEVARALVACGGFEDLMRAIGRELDHNRARVLLVAGLVTDRGPIEVAYYRFTKQRRLPERVRQHLNGVLEALPDSATRAKVNELLSHRQVTQLCHAWPPRGSTPGSVTAALADIAFGSPGWVRPWTRICALRDIVRLRLVEHAPRILESLRDSDQVVRETAGWALSELAPGLLQGAPSPLASTAAERVGGER